MQLATIVINLSDNVISEAMRRAARVDENQALIVKALRGCGASVRFLSEGNGLPDLLVGYNGHTILMEVKDGKKPPSARELTPLEEAFHRDWKGGKLAVVTSTEEALDILKGCATIKVR